MAPRFHTMVVDEASAVREIGSLDMSKGKGGKAAIEEFQTGDHVAWNTPQGETTGVVKRKLTSPAKIKDHEIAASSDHPEYLVVSDKSSAEAAHRPEALRRMKT